MEINLKLNRESRTWGVDVEREDAKEDILPSGWVLKKVSDQADKVILDSIKADKQDDE